ncbi:hypothetical protein HJC23_008888 [Cyclotella cryptica]|uniref:MBD domain-containing protein n=1 Tax=Cyclotella cryptica TaxID=29204 RepID=A0ABD3PC86_9STRA
MSSSMPPSVPCPELGSGWTLQVVPRRTGKQVDRYWYNPEGRRFRSRAEVDRFLNAEKPVKHSVVQGKYDIGQTISKSFQEEGSDSQRYFSGTITAFDEKRRLYKVVYEDHDEEELSEDEMERLVMVKNQNGEKAIIDILRLEFL